MRTVTFDPSWPESWRYCYRYDLQEIYGHVTDRGYINSYKNRKSVAIDLMQEVVAPGASILDIAAAQGNFSLALAELGYFVAWNDLRSDLADYVRLKHTHGVIAFAPGSVFDLRSVDIRVGATD